MQKRISIASLLYLGRSVYKVGPWLASGKLDIERVSNSLTDSSGSLCLNSLCKQYGFCWTTAFLWESGILVCARKKVPILSAPDKNMGH